MKKMFKYRKELIELANSLGLEDKTYLTGQVKPGTEDSPYFLLVNNQRRFIKGMLKLPFKEQRSRIAELKSIIAEQEAKKSE